MSTSDLSYLLVCSIPSYGIMHEFLGTNTQDMDNNSGEGETVVRAGLRPVQRIRRKRMLQTSICALGHSPSAPYVNSVNNWPIFGQKRCPQCCLDWLSRWRPLHEKSNWVIDNSHKRVVTANVLLAHMWIWAVFKLCYSLHNTFMMWHNSRARCNKYFGDKVNGFTFLCRPIQQKIRRCCGVGQKEFITHNSMRLYHFIR